MYPLSRTIPSGSPSPLSTGTRPEGNGPFAGWSHTPAKALINRQACAGRWYIDSERDVMPKCRMLMQELSCFPVAFPAHSVLPGCRAPFLVSRRPILPREGATHSKLLVEKEWTLFPIMLACYPKQTASTVGSTFLVRFVSPQHCPIRLSAAARHDRAAVPSP